MIFNGVFNILFGFIGGIFALLPSFPAIDSNISSAGTYIVGLASQGAAVSQYLLSTALYDAVVAVLALIWVFEPAYHGVMWVLRKIPFLNIH
jgi:hypothetical protein